MWAFLCVFIPGNTIKVFQPPTLNTSYSSRKANQVVFPEFEPTFPTDAEADDPVFM